MLKIYLDWNIITHFKETNNPDLYNLILENSRYFIFPYSKAHLNDLLVSKNTNNKYFEEDLNILSNICEDHLLEYSDDKGFVLPYKITPNAYLKEFDIELELYNTAFSKQSFKEKINDLGYSFDSFMDEMRKEHIPQISNLNLGINDFADFFNLMFDNGEYLFSNKEFAKKVKSYIQETIHEKKYKYIQGSSEKEILGIIDDLFIEQTNEGIVDFLGNIESIGTDSEMNKFITLYLTLNFSGFRFDKNRNMHNIITDAEHVFYASYCDVLVSDDSRLRSKASAIYLKSNIQTRIITSDELLSLIKGELSNAFNLTYMFDELLSLYGNDSYLENGTYIYKPLPFRFFGFFDFCIKCNDFELGIDIGLFKLGLSPKQYVYKSELQRFFDIIIDFLHEENLIRKFKDEFIDIFFTGNKELIAGIRFQFIYYNFLVQIITDANASIPVPMMCISRHR